MENSIREDIKILEALKDKKVIVSSSFYINGIFELNEEEKDALEHILSDYKRVLKENEELNKEIERQQDIIKNALYIINKNEKEKIDQIWLYNFDKCAILKGDNK